MAAPRRAPGRGLRGECGEARRPHAHSARALATFTASATWPGFQPCGGARIDYEFESRVTGTFGADGKALTAQETWTTRFASGDTTVIRFDWAATLR